MKCFYLLPHPLNLRCQLSQNYRHNTVRPKNIVLTRPNFILVLWRHSRLATEHQLQQSAFCSALRLCVVNVPLQSRLYTRITTLYWIKRIIESLMLHMIPIANFDSLWLVFKKKVNVNVAYYCDIMCGSSPSENRV